MCVAPHYVTRTASVAPHHVTNLRQWLTIVKPKLSQCNLNPDTEGITKQKLKLLRFIEMPCIFSDIKE